jgi:DNA-binding CsgD family transcriptional regulator
MSLHHIRVPFDAVTEVLEEGRRWVLVPTEYVGQCRSAAALGLSPREYQIALKVAMGLVTKEIASQLNCSAYTVTTHLRRVYAKLGVDTRGAMVARLLGLPAAESEVEAHRSGFGRVS